jgi:hypothetical protein
LVERVLNGEVDVVHPWQHPMSALKNIMVAVSEDWEEAVVVSECGKRLAARSQRPILAKKSGALSR